MTRPPGRWGPALDPRPPAVPFSRLCGAGLLYDKEGGEGGGGGGVFTCFFFKKPIEKKICSSRFSLSGLLYTRKTAEGAVGLLSLTRLNNDGQ